MAEPTSEFKVFNTLTGRVDPFVPLDAEGKTVKLYVCGPTVYDDAHLGHARCYITWDVLYRFLKFMGYDVTYVRNVTDVDDKILNRAKERGETPAELAERNYQSFTADMAALNVLPPDEEPRATQYIAHMLTGIEALIANGAAYRTADGSVYFRVSAKADYGKLKFGTDDPEALKKHLDDLKSGARVEVDEEKESPLDFALWKAVPLDDPNGWESPWPAEGAAKGWGRPGWHMECSAMNHAVFGEQIDIHAGGADLIFPHHENEIAQSEAWSGQRPFAKYWMHNGFVNVSGEKMSKSLGNFSTIKKLLERYDANTIRYFLLTNHYRMPVDFNDEALQGSANRFARIVRGFREVVKQIGLTGTMLQGVISEVQALIKVENVDEGWRQSTHTLTEILATDLNTAKALSLLNKEFDDLLEYSAHLSGEYDTFIRISNQIDPESSRESALVAMQGLPAWALDLFEYLEEAEGEFAPSKMKEWLLINDCDFYADRGLLEQLKKAIFLFSTLGFSFEFLEEMPSLFGAAAKALELIILRRKTAKAEKNWAEADRLRNEVLEQGYQILDNKDGTTSVEKDGLEIVRV